MCVWLVVGGEGVVDVGKWRVAIRMSLQELGMAFLPVESPGEC
jgi:hypothetical protein